MTATTATAPAEDITLFAAALHVGRLDDAVALYEPDAVFIPQPGAEPLHGTDQIRAALAGFAALRPTVADHEPDQRPGSRVAVGRADIAGAPSVVRRAGPGPTGS